MKRVITGVTEGEPHFALVDEVAPEIAHGMELRVLSGTDKNPPSVPFHVDQPGHNGRYLPTPPGIRKTLTHFLPDARSDTDQDKSNRDAVLNAAMAGGDGLHSTDTVDIGWIIDGELGLQLESGETVWLNAGDLVVQNGVPHRWLNRGKIPAVVGFVTLGAHLRPTMGNLR